MMVSANVAPRAFSREKIGWLKIAVLACAAVAACLGYMFVNSHFGNAKLFAYALKLRAPRLAAMVLTAYAIGAASMVFQSIINNTIVTPCLLGMNSLYTLVHTAIVFVAGTGSAFASSPNLAFALDLVVMSAASALIYGYFFGKTRGNVLYILLIGTVLTSFFSSIQSTLTRVMDPNEYDALLVTLVAGFDHVRSEIIALAAVLLFGIAFALRRELSLLDVLTLGKDQAVNLGVDYEACVRKLLLGVALYIAVATALVGPISFLGLIIANLSRRLLRTFRHSQLVAGSALFGMIALVGGQLLVEHVYDYAIPVSVFVTVSGGVYFLYLLLRGKRA